MSLFTSIVMVGSSTQLGTLIWTIRHLLLILRMVGSFVCLILLEANSWILVAQKKGTTSTLMRQSLRNNSHHLCLLTMCVLLALMSRGQ